MTQVIWTEYERNVENMGRHPVHYKGDIIGFVSVPNPLYANTAVTYAIIKVSDGSSIGQIIEKPISELTAVGDT